MYQFKKEIGLEFNKKFCPRNGKKHRIDFTSDHNEVRDLFLNRRLAGKQRNERYPGSSVGKNPLAALNIFLPLVLVLKWSKKETTEHKGWQN